MGKCSVLSARSSALVIRLGDLSAVDRDRLVALLADHDLVAVQEDDLTSPRVWNAHFASSQSRDAAADAIKHVEPFAALDLQAAEIEDDDWARRTQADLPAVRVGDVVIAPPWDLPSPAPNSSTQIVVIIEPSRGFGTGHHQSTRLCLVLLQARSLTGKTVLDVGTGSGVLAITAAKLGAAYVAAIDVDPDAVENARENVVTNQVDAVVEAHLEDFTTATRSPADVVIANLTGSILSRHADDLARYVRAGGVLIVSGFNVDERPMVETAFSPQFSIVESAEEEGWHAFVLGPDNSITR